MAAVTQVSWIDPDEVADLVRQLQGPAHAPEAGAWELHTLPLTDAPAAPAFTLDPVDPLDPLSAVGPDIEPPVAAAATDPFQDLQNAPEIDLIREQLRQLRQRAQKAGIIHPTGEPPPQLPAENPPPVPELEITAPSAPAAPSEPPPEPVAALPAFVIPGSGLGARLASFQAWARDAFNTPNVMLVDEFGDVIEGKSVHADLVISGVMAWHSQHRVDPAQMMNDAQRIVRPLPDGQTANILPVRSRYGSVSVCIISNEPLTEAAVGETRANLLAAIEQEPAQS